MRADGLTNRETERQCRSPAACRKAYQCIYSKGGTKLTATHDLTHAPRYGTLLYTVGTGVEKRERGGWGRACTSCAFSASVSATAARSLES